MLPQEGSKPLPLSIKPVKATTESQQVEMTLQVTAPCFYKNFVGENNIAQFECLYKVDITQIIWSKICLL